MADMRVAENMLICLCHMPLQERHKAYGGKTQASTRVSSIGRVSERTIRGKTPTKSSACKLRGCAWCAGEAWHLRACLGCGGPPRRAAVCWTSLWTTRVSRVQPGGRPEGDPQGSPPMAAVDSASKGPPAAAIRSPHAAALVQPEAPCWMRYVILDNAVEHAHAPSASAGIAVHGSLSRRCLSWVAASP